MRDENWITINEFVDEVISRYGDTNKTRLKTDLLRYIKERILIHKNTFYMDPVYMSGISKTFDIVKGCGDEIEIASDALLYFLPPSTLINYLIYAPLSYLMNE
ncbi:hypothetical protein [Psychrobacillus sp. FJAT-21963]|uniref:hypothetical protein n=1 Tax=Psychrobacillus sp. FJAT-21963 TaxID=1712028 RepID=UPI0006FA3EFC|nr:hypothetical protein [Psychrobacillus sp. FJAT-21963]KQL33363.1 hypothetical protein AN959_17550 [Psychrobacillus sp. FJAT-21963]